jgi:hypothetical protein
MIMQTITLQPSARTDQITDDGQELQQLPYPFHVDVQGLIQRQDFWQGKVFRVIGFTDRPEPGPLTLYWPTVWERPELAVGKYVVTSDERGQWSSHISAIQSATRHG